MLSDRVVRMLLAAVSVLLLAHLMLASLRSPGDARAAIEFPNTNKVYDVRLVTTLDMPYVREVVPMAPDETGVNFIVRTKDQIFVYRCDYFDRFPR